jgi:AcrR family transcriptional regulator
MKRIKRASTTAPQAPRPLNLALRRQPTQARARATFEHILDATARQLDATGAEGLTTNHIADAAGINVATLYQYFPSKESVLLTLFEQHTAKRALVASEVLAQLIKPENWAVTIHAAVDAVADLHTQMPGTIPLRQAMRINPQLRDFERADADRVAKVLASKLSSVGSATRSEAMLAARCLVEMVIAMLDMWLLDSGGTDKRVREQIRLAAERYLAPYFASPPGKSTKAPMARTPRSRKKL